MSESKSYIYNNRGKSLCSCSFFINSRLPQLKSGFKRTISWSKYLPKPELLALNENLNHLIAPSFQGIVILVFENDAQRTRNRRCYIPNVNIKDYNVMIDGKNFFDQPVKIIK